MVFSKTLQYEGHTPWDPYDKAKFENPNFAVKLLFYQGLNKCILAVRAERYHSPNQHAKLIANLSQINYFIHEFFVFDSNSRCWGPSTIMARFDKSTNIL